MVQRILAFVAAKHWRGQHFCTVIEEQVEGKSTFMRNPTLHFEQEFRANFLQKKKKKEVIS